MSEGNEYLNKIQEIEKNEKERLLTEFSEQEKQECIDVLGKLTKIIVTHLPIQSKYELKDEYETVVDSTLLIKRLKIKQ